jgi:hypothetical protein
MSTSLPSTLQQSQSTDHSKNNPSNNRSEYEVNVLIESIEPQPQSPSTSTANFLNSTRPATTTRPTTSSTSLLHYIGYKIMEFIVLFFRRLYIFQLGFRVYMSYKQAQWWINWFGEPKLPNDEIWEAVNER